jgi:ppGpp synthetase/RelA/SpoT-type nucleotidyltranferase
LHYFPKQDLFDEVTDVNGWYDNYAFLHELAIDYRIKSIQSAQLKYKKYYPDHQARKVFDDLLGFRSLCDNYDDVFELKKYEKIRVEDMSFGKAEDDGYRGVHAYFQLDNYHYPIEIQYNTYFDRQFNNWLHKYFYKKGYQSSTGRYLRELYECAKILTEKEFKEALQHVLSGSKGC